MHLDNPRSSRTLTPLHPCFPCGSSDATLCGDTTQFTFAESPVRAAPEATSTSLGPGLLFSWQSLSLCDQACLHSPRWVRA